MLVCKALFGSIGIATRNIEIILDSSKSIQNKLLRHFNFNPQTYIYIVLFSRSQRISCVSKNSLNK